VNVICPGAISTEIGDNTKAENDDVKILVEYPEGNIPLTGGKSGSAEQVGELIAFLASYEASHMSGTVLHLLELGHRRMLHLAAPSSDGYRGRRRGFIRTMRAAGLQPQILMSDYSPEEAARMIGSILDSRDRPTAVLRTTTRRRSGHWTHCIAGASGFRRRCR
jgi:hypothetical protein